MFHRVVRLILNEMRDMKVCNLVTSAGRPLSVIFVQLSCSLVHSEETQQRLYEDIKTNKMQQLDVYY